MGDIVLLNETESHYYNDFFVRCDVEKQEKIPIFKIMELYRAANLTHDIILEITALAEIPTTALYVSRLQFYALLKLIAAHQAGLTLRRELLNSGVVPLPHFNKINSPLCGNENNEISLGECTVMNNQVNGFIINNISPIEQQQIQIIPKSQQNSATSSRRNSNISIKTHINPQTIVLNNAGTDSTCDSSDRETLRRSARGSPEAWSTNSDSPTPTNSVVDRPWAKETLWQGLLGDEHRQLLGTEEESSDRHSSDDENNEKDFTVNIEAVYQISSEQREYYHKQFKTVQQNENGLLSGQVARAFFEKSRIPVDELRHIWQLCDVTRDGALSLAEFIAAMHLVVLRRNNIPLPSTLPTCLHPNNMLSSGSTAISSLVAPTTIQQPQEADLLHLNDDDEEDNTDNTITNPITNVLSVEREKPFNNKNIMSISSLSTSSQISGNTTDMTTTNTCFTTPSPAAQNSPSNTEPVAAKNAVIKAHDINLWKTEPSAQWTKFNETPTTNVSSPGPVNFDMQRTAQAVVSDPQILHPVPLRVTPIAGMQTNNVKSNQSEMILRNDVVGDNTKVGRENSPKQQILTTQTTTTVTTTTTTIAPTTAIALSNTTAAITMVTAVTTTTNTQRDLLSKSNDLRGIQRPQAKKLPLLMNVGILPPPPQRELPVPNVGEFNVPKKLQQTNIKSTHIEVPPLPPPPHRHNRSSSLDLNKFKITNAGTTSTTTGTNITNKFQQTNGNIQNNNNPEQYSPKDHPISLPTIPPMQLSLQSNQRISAFEIYRKPPQTLQSPPLQLSSRQKPHLSSQQMPLSPFGAGGAVAFGIPPQYVGVNADFYEKRVNSIGESLQRVNFKNESNITDVLRHLREQNNLLLHLCNDLSDELLAVQTRKEEMRFKLEEMNLKLTDNQEQSLNASNPQRNALSNSAPIAANNTGSSESMGI